MGGKRLIVLSLALTCSVSNAHPCLTINHLGEEEEKEDGEENSENSTDRLGW